MILERDGALWYDVVGQGPPLLLLHGGVGLDHTTLRPWLEPLADQATLVFHDLRGNGRSAEPADWSRVTHDTWVADIDALRAHLGIERLVLLGHSYGGFLALDYALRHPDRVAGLVLCSTAAVMDYLPQAVEDAARRYPDRIEPFLRATAQPPASDEELARIWPAITPLYLHRPSEALVDSIVGRVRARAGACRRGFFELLPEWDVSGRLGEIRAPTLITVGAHDFITPPEPCARRLHQGIAGSALEVFEGSGHYPFAEEPARYQEVLRAWLARATR